MRSLRNFWVYLFATYKNKRMIKNVSTLCCVAEGDVWIRDETRKRWVCRRRLRCLGQVERDDQPHLNRPEE